ncbi:hypothetical protein K469DRAFT_715268 [Zopfia rhizophila CBS 207.26]|uniref:Cupin type-1 domain-containing protein n=1 Tax=Zopfia rhizophila CBS 207.26 TaxID=1314779 RepID=A0A6A6ETK6_9PEZI|nr:hypothetical protein K469DRAFT_715268 [Zopfia rhizophila CBS 207.26]
MPSPNPSRPDIPTILESNHTTSGAQTVIEVPLPPLSTVYPHYHSSFSETFTLLSGSISVFKCLS